LKKYLNVEQLFSKLYIAVKALTWFRPHKIKGKTFFELKQVQVDIAYKIKGSFDKFNSKN